MSYTPEAPPENYSREYLYRELLRISNTLQTGSLPFASLAKTHNTPTKPRDGDVYYADGTNWNPGHGEGPYMYFNSRWNYLDMSDFWLEVAKGNVTGHSFVHKFGANSAVGTSIVPICQGGFYRTPTGTATLEVISSSTSDTAAGVGAREISINYLDSNFASQTGTIATNGTSASSETIAGVKRVLRAWVSDSGSYASQTTPSQVGTITIRESGGGNTWAVLPEIVTGFGAGQSLIGAYTVPAGYTAYILSGTINVDSVKSVDMYFFARENANDTTAGYSAMRMKNIYIGVSGEVVIDHKTFEAYPEYTDIGFMGAVASGTAEVSVEFELLLVAN